MFCREAVRAVRVASIVIDDYPPVLIFFQETETQGRRFFGRYWPGARAVSDPDGAFYAAFGLEHGTGAQLAGAPVWVAAVRAVVKGNLPGPATADPLMMPGVSVIQGNRVIWRHHYRHIADHPDFRAIPRIVSDHRGP